MPRPRRYQLRKEAVAIVERGHPWIFREQLSSAAHVFAGGDLLRLVDGTNRVVGHGIYEAEGAIAIRIVRRGPDAPDAAWLRDRLAASLARRRPLAARTDAIRLVHGESDDLPAIVVDRFADTLVISSYSAGTDARARYLARYLPSLGAAPTGADGDASVVGPATHVVLRPAHRRRGAPEAPRVMRGEPPAIVRFREDDLDYAVDLAGGQKTGTYLDLRGLRRELAEMPLGGARVLNLFAYSGMLGLAAERAGAAAIVQVDASERALAFAAAHHVRDPARHRFVVADAFAWIEALAPGEHFDLIIVDPPSMTSKKAQVPNALAAYRRLYRAAAAHVAPGGAVVAACCTSRIERPVFHRTVRESLGPTFTRERELPPEADHPVAFPQADYLKIALWRRST
ncbi:MAG: class I SAM-dependent rRNA methyltransferase [Deltaproteobacteria bacterium]|nr:class I SAM-dependent rRNA methyltransferase [Deltaproteobacteria bacterium]